MLCMDLTYPYYFYLQEYTSYFHLSIDTPSLYPRILLPSYLESLHCRRFYFIHLPFTLAFPRCIYRSLTTFWNSN